MPQRQEFIVARVHARREDGHFIGFRAAVGEIALLQFAGRNRGHLFRQVHHGFGDEERGRVLDLVDLRFDLLRHLGVRVAHTDGHDAAQEVEKLLALDVPNVLALGMVNHHRVLEVGGDAVEKVFLLFANDFVFGHGNLKVDSLQSTVDSQQLTVDS